MKELIKISEREGKQVVSARELYAFLGATERFSSWFDRQIQYGFELGVDYIGCKEFNALANQELTDYAMTIDMAKELSMLQRNEKGKQARLYFIECEKSLRLLALPSYQIKDPIKRAERWIEEQKEKQQAQLEAKEAQDNVKRLVHDSKTYTAGEIAKEVGLRSAIELNNRLAKMEVQFKQNGTWLLYAKYADLGYTSVKQTVLDNGRIIYDRRWTGAGRDFIVSLFKEDE